MVQPPAVHLPASLPPPVPSTPSFVPSAPRRSRGWVALRHRRGRPERGRGTGHRLRCGRDPAHPNPCWPLRSWTVGTSVNSLHSICSFKFRSCEHRNAILYKLKNFWQLNPLYFPSVCAMMVAMCCHRCFLCVSSQGLRLNTKRPPACHLSEK